MCNEISRRVRFLYAGFENLPDVGTHARLWMGMAIRILSERMAEHVPSQRLAAAGV
jgi:hypothetical protein